MGLVRFPSGGRFRHYGSPRRRRTWVTRFVVASWVLYAIVLAVAVITLIVR